ncbi:MAG: hypothetical protein COA58_15695 [Bacteroidetes bacterium]|nr:MAG: hypothetical protein COA58_15695 [Bacteroidota bacterium]
MGTHVHKMYFLTCVCLYLSIFSMAQVTYDKEIEYPFFESVQTTDQFLFTFTKLGKTFDQSELIIYNHSGEELNRITFQSKRRPELIQTAKMGGNTVFQLSTGEYVVIDGTGKEIARHTTISTDKIKRSQMLLTNSGATLIQQVKVKKVGVGLRVRHFNTEFEEQWKYEKFPEKGRYGYDMCAAKEDGNIAIIYTKGSMSYDKGICLLSPTGEEKAFENLGLKQTQLKSYKFENNFDGDWLYIGDYGSTSSETFKGIPLGMSIVKISSDNGALKSESLIDFVELQKKVGDKREDGTPVYSQSAPALHLLDIINIRGKSYYMCESYLSKERKYTKPGSTQSVDNINYYTQMILMDYYLLDVLNPTDNPKRIWKQSHNIEQELGSFGGAYGARQNLLKNGLFSYQGMHNGKIVTRGYAQMHNYYTLIDPDLGKEETENRVFWGDPIGKDVGVLPQRKSYNVSFGQTVISPYFSREGLLKNGDEFTLYQYDVRTNMLKLSKLNF